jgi:hypothetical protein
MGDEMCEFISKYKATLCACCFIDVMNPSDAHTLQLLQRGGKSCMLHKQRKKIPYSLRGADRNEAHGWHTPARDGWHAPSQPRVRESFICEHVPGILLQNRAAHVIERTFVRQIARQPQPPIELLIVHFS